MASKLIFRKLIEAEEQIQASLRSKEFSSEDDSLEKKQLSALRMIFNYTNNETWAVQERSRRKAMIFMKNHCNYERTRDELHAKSKNSVEASMSYLSKKLEAKIGASTIDLILEGRVDEAMIQFHVRTGKLNPAEYLIEGLFDLLPTPNNFNIKLETCEKEIKFILIFAKKHLADLAAKYNNDNLSHLMYILTSTDSFVANERKVLYQLLNGEFSRDARDESVELNVQIAIALEEYTNL